MTNLSHEIRTPMNGILGFAELLKQEDLSDADKKTYINLINENGNTLLNLLNNIISFSKIEDKHTSISLSKFHASEVLKRVYSALSYKPSELVDFKVLASESDEDLIQSDMVLLYQIISNLCFNALKVTKEGFVHLDLNIEDQHITFIIKDTGLGICQTKHANLFKQFEQDRSNNDTLNLEGSGLGLTISYKLSQLLEGELNFESKKGLGSTFYLKLLKTKSPSA
ncbi:sensor histidine kinase [Carboxylicivirga marina]|uniref:sensor histidine kinase n=1 Tax=Carboxylicivirga marina TaxID=2800988 RepID=UPI002594F54E|nr:HAMP domain-containing sensor histidine kinase [uncultured Carboxylicivirga sp.]